MRSPIRIVHHADAHAWLKSEKVAGASFITSMPDYSEFPAWPLAQWKSWFTASAEAVLRATADAGVAIFYQRDAKKGGEWIDKAYLIQKAAEATGHAQLWHKIICRIPPGNVAYGKPAYSHLLCFSKGVRLELAQSTPDVILAAGKTTWARGMGVGACELACKFVLDRTPTRTIVDPFCGQGSVLAIANQLGLDAIGVELSRKRADRAQRLEMSLDGHWSLPREADST